MVRSRRGSSFLELEKTIPPFFATHRYPHCLFFLDLLQDADFRTAIKDFSYAEHIRQAQDSFFRNFHSNRVAEAEGKATAAPAEDANGVAAFATV